MRGFALLGLSLMCLQGCALDDEATASADGRAPADAAADVPPAPDATPPAPDATPPDAAPLDLGGFDGAVALGPWRLSYGVARLPLGETQVQLTGLPGGRVQVALGAQVLVGAMAHQGGELRADHAPALAAEVRLALRVLATGVVCGELQYQGLRLDAPGLPTDGVLTLVAHHADGAPIDPSAVTCADVVCWGDADARRCARPCPEGRCHRGFFCRDDVRGAPAPVCQPLDQACVPGAEAEPCGGPAVCTVAVGVRPACGAPGDAAEGAVCVRVGPDAARCAEGLACADGLCRRPCPATGCPAGCVPLGEDQWGLCASACDPFDGTGCAAGQICRFAPVGDRRLGWCVPQVAEPLPEGAPCALGSLNSVPVQPCAAGQVCAGRSAPRCVAPCAVGGEACPVPATCVSLDALGVSTHAGLGVCRVRCDVLDPDGCGPGEVCDPAWFAVELEGTVRAWVGTCQPDHAGQPVGAGCAAEPLGPSPCAPGAFCRMPFIPPMTPGGGTGVPDECIQVCDLGAADPDAPCGPDLVCTPTWLSEGAAAGVGICAVDRAP